MFAVGNWKMNLTLEEALGLASGVVSQVSELGLGAESTLQVGIAPPFPYLHAVGTLLEGSGVELVAQDCHAETKGAFTSWVSAPMLRSVGVRRVIVGHSERRKHGGDDDTRVRAKLEAALAAGLGVILCVGESLEEREAGRQAEVVGTQLRAALTGLSVEQWAETVIAYEPLWAIGTGKTASPEQAGEMHTQIIGQILPELLPAGVDAPFVLYGGSVKPANIDALAAIDGVGGVLVGGASLEANSFGRIAQGCAPGGGGVSNDARSE